MKNITENYCPKCGYDTLKDGNYCIRMSCGYSRALTATMLEWRQIGNKKY